MPMQVENRSIRLCPHESQLKTGASGGDLRFRQGNIFQ